MISDCDIHGKTYYTGCDGCKQRRREKHEQNRERDNFNARKWYRLNKDRQKQRDREYYVAHKERIKYRHRLYYYRNQERCRAGNKKRWEENPDYLKTALCSSARTRARKKGITGTIRVQDVFWPTHCPILGTELNYATGIERKKLKRENMPSLDRKDNDKGYVPGNVFVISWKANTLKSDMSVDQIYALWKYMTYGI